MAREVQHTLQELISSLSPVDGELFLHNLKDSGRYQVFRTLLPHHQSSCE